MPSLGDMGTKREPVAPNGEVGCVLLGAILDSNASLVIPGSLDAPIGGRAFLPGLQWPV